MRTSNCRINMIVFPTKMLYYCPCCGLRFRSFVSGDFRDNLKRFNPSRYEHTKQNVLCPVCKSMPRHRILARWFEKYLEYLRTADILYFAPNRSEIIWLKNNNVSCVTADLYAKTDLKLDIQ